jgi:hypothetical protein
MCSSIEPVESLHEALDRLQASDPALLPVAEQAERVHRLLAAQARLEAATLSAVAAFDAAGGAQLTGDRSTRVWLSRGTMLSPAAAAGMVRLASGLHQHLPETLDALARGEITGRHACAIASIVGRVGVAHVSKAEPILLDIARRSDPPAVWAAVRHIHELVDPAGAERAAVKEYDRRYVSFSISNGRGYLDGVLDPESAEVLQTALMSLMKPTPEDTRTPRQRRADALVDLAKRALNAGDLTGVDGTAMRPHLSLVVDADAIAARRGSATLPWTGALIGGQALRRLACDARLTPVLARLLGPQCQHSGTTAGWRPLALGRSVRTASPAQFIALRVRDGGCVIPGCRRSYAFTDAHHVTHWADGGPTDLSNLVMLCTHHHRALHAGHWTITPDPCKHGRFLVTDRRGRVAAAQHSGDRAPP